jgi:hypothetical protein
MNVVVMIPPLEDLLDFMVAGLSLTDGITANAVVNLVLWTFLKVVDIMMKMNVWLVAMIFVLKIPVAAVITRVIVLYHRKLPIGVLIN